MTYKTLLAHLSKMSAKELDQEISCYDLANDNSKEVIHITKDPHSICGGVKHINAHTICVV